jgi:hypothetical protein
VNLHIIQIWTESTAEDHVENDRTRNEKLLIQIRAALQIGGSSLSLVKWLDFRPGVVFLVRQKMNAFFFWALDGDLQVSVSIFTT